MRNKVVLLLLVILVLFVSCSSSSDVCYYTYFEESAGVLIYSHSKDTLYYIDIPFNLLREYGEQKEVYNVAELMTKFSGLFPSGLIQGTAYTKDAIYELLDTLAEKKLNSTEERLKTVVENASLLSNSTFLNNMNKLTSSDLTDLARVLNSNTPDVCYLDAGLFLTDDSQFSQKYFKEWLNQVLK